MSVHDNGERSIGGQNSVGAAERGREYQNTTESVATRPTQMVFELLALNSQGYKIKLAIRCSS
ncbi:hypothetical protein E2C01_022037 [Portunus trituberculatus]|uniref:Uncharacterized protein n=1 Tax=Portunus trituberculatus TaxID=210409 RepID=A0A5B7E6I4_PORTR|nr:hypothetical protein [Portunus trituberculatus]